MVSVADAVLDMILQDYLGGIIERRAHRRKLDEHIGAVPPILDHALHGLKVPDGTGKPVHDGLCLRVRMPVTVSMFMLMGVSVDVTGERIDRRRYRIRLNDPSVIDLHRSVTVDGTEYDCCYIELGCPGLPHAVVRLDGFDKMDENELRKLGRALRSSPAFPKGANVNFVELTGRDALRIKTFERGVEDFTLACGTGCGSSVAALTLSGQVSGRDVTLQSPGGVLNVTLTQDGGTVRDIYLTGPTNIVCIGEVTDEDLLIEAE